MLQQKEGIPTPTNDYEWTGLRRMCIDVRREHVLADTLREMFKPRFDTTILLKVLHGYNYNANSSMQCSTECSAT